MHLTILHGYLLQGTGSNIYVANVARAWSAQGHAVTVICQDRAAESLPFVNEYIGPHDAVPKSAPRAGHIRVIVPYINDLLPVYVMDRYNEFLVKTIPELTAEEIETHIALTAATLRSVARAGTDRVLANHVMLGPVIAKRGLDGTGVPYDVKIHGSAIEYTLVPNPRLMHLAVEGLSEATRIFVGSGYVRERVLEVFSAESDLRLADRLEVVSPGMDPDLFRLATDMKSDQARFVHRVGEMIQLNGSGRRAQHVPAVDSHDPDAYHGLLVKQSETYDQRAVDADLLERWIHVKPDEPIVLYIGKFLPAKGVGELMLTVPAMLSRVPRTRFVFVGFGTYREHLEGVLQGLRAGDSRTVTSCAQAGCFADEADVDRWFRPLTEAEADRVTITGMLDHATLSQLLPMASVSIVPSKWPEAFGMVAVEAMAAGVLPICSYHAGLRDVVDAVCSEMPELAALMRLDRKRFADELPNQVHAALTYLYPSGYGEHGRRQAIGRQLRALAVKDFSWDHIAGRLLTE